MSNNFCSTAMEPANCVAVAPENPNRRDSAPQTIAQLSASMNAARAKNAGDLAKKEKIFFDNMDVVGVVVGVASLLLTFFFRSKFLNIITVQNAALIHRCWLISTFRI